jgi:hypothetical protein
MLTGTRRAGSLAASAGAAGGEMKTRAGREGGHIGLGNDLTDGQAATTKQNRARSTPCTAKRSLGEARV